MKLENDKHERFCQEYIIDLNATKAAERSEYSKKTAYSIGQRLLKNVEIQKRITELKEIRSERTVVTQDMVIRELLILATSDFKDYGEIVDPYGTKTTQRLKLKKFSEMKGDVTKAIKSISEKVTKDGVQLSFKLHGKTPAIELLGRHIGMFTNKLEHSGLIGLKLTAEDIFEALKAAEKAKKK